MLLKALICGAFLVSCFSEGMATTAPPKPDDHFVSECTNLVCAQAHEQAKGLAKLALLDEFVSQTVYLLDDLMKNIDGELGRSAQSLLRYIHPNCSPTQRILQEVIQKRRQREVAHSSRDLSEGIQPAAAVTEPTSTHPSINEDYDRWPYERGTDAGTDGFWIDPSIYRASSGDDQISSSSSTQTYEGRQPKSEWSEEENLGANSWSGSNKKPYKSSGNELSSGFGSHGKDGAETKSPPRGKNISFQSNEKNPTLRSQRCRGVSKGSMFWTPGLDNWCKQNCDNGFCPKTHCIC